MYSKDISVACNARKNGSSGDDENYHDNAVEHIDPYNQRISLAKERDFEYIPYDRIVLLADCSAQAGEKLLEVFIMITGDSNLARSQTRGIWKVRNHKLTKLAKASLLILQHLTEAGILINLQLQQRGLNTAADAVSKTHFCNSADVEALPGLPYPFDGACDPVQKVACAV